MAPCRPTSAPKTTRDCYIVLVRVERLELPRLAAPEPKSGVSTNFTIPAFRRSHRPIAFLTRSHQRMPQIFLGPCERFRGFPSAASLYHSFSSDQRENARARCPYPACLRTGGLPSLQPGADRNAMRRRMPMRCANCISSMWTLHCTNRFKRPIFTSWNSKQRTPPPSAALIGLAALLLPVANRLCDARRSSPGGRSLPLPHCTLQVIHLPTILAHVHFPAP